MVQVHVRVTSVLNRSSTLDAVSGRRIRQTIPLRGPPSPARHTRSLDSARDDRVGEKVGTNVHPRFWCCLQSAEILRWESLALPRTPLPQDDGARRVPQGLKPNFGRGRNGPAKAGPFPQPFMHNIDFPTQWTEQIPHRLKPVRNDNGWRVLRSLTVIHGGAGDVGVWRANAAGRSYPKTSPSG
jgi:hypothetical protein